MWVSTRVGSGRGQQACYAYHFAGAFTGFGVLWYGFGNPLSQVFSRPSRTLFTSNEKVINLLFLVRFEPVPAILDGLVWHGGGDDNPGWRGGGTCG